MIAFLSDNWERSQLMALSYIFCQNLSMDFFYVFNVCALYIIWRIKFLLYFFKKRKRIFSTSPIIKPDFLFWIPPNTVTLSAIHEILVAGWLVSKQVWWESTNFQLLDDRQMCKSDESPRISCYWMTYRCVSLMKVHEFPVIGWPTGV